MQEYIFSDEQWEKIEKYLPKRNTGRPYKNLRATVNGIYWIMKTGMENFTAVFWKVAGSLSVLFTLDEGRNF